MPLLLTLALTGLLAPAAALVPATSSAPTCFGAAATIVVSSEEDVFGTTGDDVIVSTSQGLAGRVFALEGNDKVCAAGGQVDAGPGNDSVQSLAPASGSLTTILGPGNDVYVGSEGRDHVDLVLITVPPSPPESYVRAGDDITSTGGGVDSAGSGVTDMPNRDRIDLGSGDDGLEVIAPPGSDVAADGGLGANALSFFVGGTATDLLLDMPNSRVTRADGGGVALAGVFVDIRVSNPGGAVRMTGGDRGEEFSVLAQQLDAKMRGGNDVVSLVPSASESARGRISGGSGRDEVRASSLTALTGDLGDHSLTTDNGADQYRIVGVENLYATARRVTVEGDRKGNHIKVAACAADLRGGRGSDSIELFGSPGGFDYGPCRRYGPFLLKGQRGDDVLQGDSGNDRLIGGLGFDVARGSSGNDVCRAERKRNCER